MSAKQNVKLPRKPASNPTDFTSHPLLAMMDIEQLKEQARHFGEQMRRYRQMERTARQQHKAYNWIQEQFWKERNSLREVQRAYRKRIENMKVRGLL